MTQFDPVAERIKWIERELERLRSFEVHKTYFGILPNYAQFNSNGTLRLYGSATVWDDERVPVTATTLGGTKDPGFTVFKTDGAGSQGVFLYWFDNSTEEELYFTLQLPHCWKEGSTIYPHVHWTPSITADGVPANQRVKWSLEYTWANRGGDFGNTAYVGGAAHTPADADVVAGRHYITDLTAISGVGKTISSMLVCRIFRQATDAVFDTYEHDAGLLEIDFHIEIDSLGSETEAIK